MATPAVAGESPDHLNEENPMRRSSDRGEVQIGDTHVRIRLPAESSIACAQILGWRSREPGREHVVLDRLVHRLDDDAIDGWSVRGAVVTELCRKD